MCTKPERTNFCSTHIVLFERGREDKVLQTELLQVGHKSLIISPSNMHIACVRTPVTVYLCVLGWYWVFSIIISACYTGCIIAFVTLPVYPSYVDNGYDVLYHGFKVGTLSKYYNK
jgi:hypothetical protein